MDEASSSGTVTQRLQAELESAVQSIYEEFGAATTKERSLMLTLHHDEHEEFVVRGLRRLSSGYYVLDSSRPWLCYWILHSLALLGRAVDDDLYDRTIEFLEHCQDPEGGYAGGPGQMPHLATTYAATCALVTLGGEKALSSINRKKVLQFLLRMKDPCGGFRVHDDGEMDMRGSFCALAVAHLLDIMVPEIVENVGLHVRSCQTYEGGIGAEPGAEAHGGYTFCGLAALALVNQLNVLDLPSLVNWVAFRQGRVEGGFQGRTNKLVDGCYSFWQGGCFHLLQQYMPELLVQQKASAAALHTFQNEVDNTKPGPLDARAPEQPVAAASGSETRNLKSQAESSNNELDGVVGDQAESVKDRRSCADDSVIEKDEARNQGSQATSSTPASQTGKEKMNKVTTTEVEARQELHSATKDIPDKEQSDEDEVEFWDLYSGDNSAERLFPMSEPGVRRVPSHTKIVEVVELPDDWQGAPAAASGSHSIDFPESTVDLGSWDDVLYGPIFNSQALQAYILLCCQDLDGGLRDKPGKSVDFYHTCYCLSGLSAAQYSTAHRVGAPPPTSGVLGPYSNLLEATHALCNVRLDRYNEAQRHFKQREGSLDL
ncbi:unnamed protein product [Calypogeia fissa]